MIPIKELLDKIRWDKREDPKDYTLYYFDRIQHKLLSLHYTDIVRIDEGFLVLERNNEEVNIPPHRIKQVKKKDKIIWER